MSWKVSVLFPPPIGAVELVSTENTFWIAEDNWVVLDIVPTNHVDLSFLGIDPFSIPGLKTELTDEIVSVGEVPKLPNAITLYQNYPNPFNPSTTIKFRIIENEFVSLKIYDLLGNEIATLVEEEKPAGEYNIDFKTYDLQLTSGVYFYRLKAGSFEETKSMILLK